MPTKLNAEGVVKPLVWRDATKGDGCPLRRDAETVFGVLRIFQYGAVDVWFFEYLGTLRGYPAGQTEEQAKAAAQADYERRILSCLTPEALDNSKPTPAVGDDGLIAALLAPTGYDDDGLRNLLDQAASALAAAHSQHEADVARIAGLEQERDDLRKTNASLHRRTQYAERFRKSREVLRTELWGLIKRHIAREAAAVRRAEAAESALAKVKP